MEEEYLYEKSAECYIIERLALCNNERTYLCGSENGNEEWIDNWRKEDTRQFYTLDRAKQVLSQLTINKEKYAYSIMKVVREYTIQRVFYVL